MSRRGWVLFAVMSVIWGLPYLLIRVAVDQLPPPVVVLIRVGLATLVLLPVCLIKGLPSTLLPAVRRWRPLLAYTVIEIAVPWLLLTRAERELSSSLAGILVAATALVAAALGWLLRTNDQLDITRVAGLIVGFGGVVVLLGLDLSQLSWVPLLEMAGVIGCYAVGPVILSRWLADLPALGVVTASVGLTAVGYLPLVLLGPPVTWSVVTAGTVWALVVLAVICTAAAFVLFFALITEIGPARAVIITYVNPAVALVLGVAVLGERITTGMAVGFPLILLGSGLAARRARQRETLDPPVAAVLAPTGASASEPATRRAS